MSDRNVIHYLTNRGALQHLAGELATEIPQADIRDDCVTRLEPMDWRWHFAARLKGKGLEIGPLHRPLPTHPDMQIRYLDRASQADLKAVFPEVAEGIVAVDIVDDAESLATVPAMSFDFVVAAHVIEHMRNPIGALVNWLRVIRPGGYLYLIVPDKRRTFDRHRVRTLFEHLILDYEEPSRERDFEHFLDYAVHVHGTAASAALPEAKRLREIDYSIHFHVFIPRDIVRLIEHVAATLAPVSIDEGPVMCPDDDEFHLLLKVPGQANARTRP
jgi:SAM-dependent methyltransferase